MVFAPNARRVSVVGDFNFWDGRRHAMRVRGNGYWEIFVPGARAGDKYKYEIIAAERPAAAAQGRPGGLRRRECGPRPRRSWSMRTALAAAGAGWSTTSTRCQRADVDL